MLIILSFTELKFQAMPASLSSLEATPCHDTILKLHGWSAEGTPANYLEFERIIIRMEDQDGVHPLKIVPAELETRATASRLPGEIPDLHD